MEKISKNYQDFLYLLYCGLNSKTAEKKRASQMDFKALLSIAKYQNLVNVAYEPIKEFCHDLEWIQAYEQGVRRSILFEEERKLILDFLESQKIWYAPLKGVALQELYPVYGMRQMNDNDFLFDCNKKEVVESFMTERGYKLERTQMHDAYTKSPMYNFEFHKEIYLSYVPESVNSYFRNVEKLLISRKPSYEHKLSLNDLYLHVVCHFINHLECSYGGLKFLCDIYVIQKYAFEQENLARFNKLSEDLYISKIETILKNLSMKLFSEENSWHLNGEELKILNACIENGDQGNFQNYIKNKLKKEAKNPREILRLGKQGLKTWGLKNILKSLRYK